MLFLPSPVTCKFARLQAPHPTPPPQRLQLLLAIAPVRTRGHWTSGQDSRERFDYKLGMMKRTGKPCTNLGLSPRDPFSWASTISASPPYPGSSLPSSPLLCFQPPRSPSPAWAAVPPRPPLPRWQVSLCLTGSRLRRALSLLLTSTQLLQEEEGRAARGWIRDSRFGVCS